MNAQQQMRWSPDHPQILDGLVRTRTHFRYLWPSGATANPSRGSFRCMTEWTLRLIGTGIDGQSRSFDVTAISRPEGLGDIANLGLTLAEAKSCWCKSYRSSHDIPINGRSRGHRWEKKEDPEF
jgi:hypothetical protein